MMSKLIFLFIISALLTSCLKTRGDLSEQEQSRLYGKKSADNQATAQSPAQSQLNTKAAAAVDEKDDLIRGFNGRIESLENQITTLQKEKAALANSADTQKLQLMQDALVKMEAQIQRLEAEAAAAAASPIVPSKSQAQTPTPSSSDTNTKNNSEASPKKSATAKTESSKKESAAVPASGTAYDIAQDFFGKKEWKKAILSYQKYVDENSKGKNVADAKYKIGVCFQELGMKEEAMAFYEEVIANYAKAEAGKKAKIRLAKLKK